MANIFVRHPETEYASIQATLACLPEYSAFDEVFGKEFPSGVVDARPSDRLTELAIAVLHQLSQRNLLKPDRDVGLAPGSSAALEEIVAKLRRLQVEPERVFVTGFTRTSRTFMDLLRLWPDLQGLPVQTTELLRPRGNAVDRTLYEPRLMHVLCPYGDRRQMELPEDLVSFRNRLSEFLHELHLRGENSLVVCHGTTMHELEEQSRTQAGQNYFVTPSYA